MEKPERYVATCPTCTRQISAMSVAALKAAKDQHTHYHAQQTLSEAQ